MLSTSFPLSFQKGFYLQSWHGFSYISGYVAIVAEAFRRSSTSTVGQRPWKTCGLQSFMLGLEDHDIKLQEYLLSKSEALTEEPAVQI